MIRLSHKAPKKYHVEQKRGWPNDEGFISSVYRVECEGETLTYERALEYLRRAKQLQPGESVVLEQAA